MSAGVILALRMSALEIETSFYRAYLVDCFFSFMSSSSLSKLRWDVVLASDSVLLFFFFIFHVDRKRKPHCIVLLGTATTLLPKHCVKQVATWTLKTKKGRLRSWQHLLGVTMISWSAWQNTGLIFMQQTRLVWVAFSQELCSDITGVTEPDPWIASFERCKPAWFPWHGFSEQFTRRQFRTAAVFKVAHW